MQGKINILKSISSSIIKNEPYKLNFAITSACNSHCRTCNVWKVYRKNPNIIKDNLTISEIKKIFKNLPPNFVWLALSGGETFLRADLYDICKAAAENIPHLGIISIPSNGLLQEHIVKTVNKILKLPIDNLYLNFSIDGPEKIHDKIRGIKGGFVRTWDTYEKILKLSKSNPKLHVNIETTISSFNIKILNDFLKGLIEKDHKITITIAHTGYLYQNTTRDYFVKIHNEKKLLTEIINTIKSELNSLSPMDYIQKVYLDNILNYYAKPKKQPIKCTALKSSIAMDAFGNLTPCFMWNKQEGNIRDFKYSLKDFWVSQQEELKNTRRVILMEKCPNCWTPCEAYQSIINKTLLQ